MNNTLRALIHGLILLIGLVLMAGGIVTGKHGATVVGLIVAAVNVQQWLAWNKRRNAGGKTHTGQSADGNE